MHPRVMVERGTRGRQVGRCPIATQTGKECTHADQDRNNSDAGPQATVSIRLSQEASPRPQLRSVADPYTLHLVVYFYAVGLSDMYRSWWASPQGPNRVHRAGAQQARAVVPVQSLTPMGFPDTTDNPSLAPVLQNRRSWGFRLCMIRALFLQSCRWNTHRAQHALPPTVTLHLDAWVD